MQTSVSGVKVIISNIFILLSFTALMALSGNCRCVFGPHSSFSFKFHHRNIDLFFVCNRLHAKHQQRPEKTVRTSHTGELKSESVALKA